jgi:acyl carrier protein
MDEILKIQEKIFNYIRENTHSDNSKINSKTLLFKEGIFDSMGFVLLIDFLEEKLGIKANDEDLIEENFESVEAIANFIRNKSTEYVG